MSQRILSGMQATGVLHIGHYLGVLTNYVKMQREFDCFFMVANLHSLTAYYTSYPTAHAFIAPLVADWLAAGIDPTRACIFVQSDVAEHTELAQILAMFTPVSWLERNPTYKDKQQNSETDLDSFGFLGYPVLQTADILLYGATHVPIGEDQLPHLELSREIARRFNHYYRKEKQDVFIEPKPVLSDFPKVAGLDGRKMSKSYNNSIALADSEADVLKKISSMKTDTNRVKRTDPGNPENCTAFSYYNYFAPELKPAVIEDCRSAKLGCVDCKKQLGQKVAESLAPFREKRLQLQKEPDTINDILRAGAQKASLTARTTMERVKASMGMVKDYRL